MLTEHQQKMRQGRIGSSEIAMLVMGADGNPLSPFGGPHALWRRKTGQDIDLDLDNNTAIRRGNKFERAIAELWAEDTDVDILKARTVHHEKYQFTVDTPDFFEIPKGADKKKENATALIEVKSVDPSMYWKWGEAGSSDIPKHYALQCHWHIGHHPGLDECKVIVSFGRMPVEYTIKRDDELFLALVFCAERFERDHLRPGTPAPAVDGHENTSKWLSQRLEQKRDDIRKATAQESAWMADLREAVGQHDVLGDRIATLENQLKNAIGENAGLYDPETRQRITFKETKGRPKTDWPGVLAALGVSEKADPFIDEYTTRTPYRVFSKRGLFK